MPIDLIQHCLVGSNDEQIDPGTAELLVRAALSIERVGAGSAPHDVVAATAVKLIFAATTGENIVGSKGVGLSSETSGRVREEVRANDRVPEEHVVAIVTGKDFTSSVSVECISSTATEELIACESILSDVGRLVEHGRSESKDRIPTFTTKKPLSGLSARCVSSSTEDLIFAIVAIEVVDAVSAIDDVVSCTATYHVIPVATIHVDVIARACIKVIDAEATFQSIDIRSAKHDVVAILTAQRIPTVTRYSIDRQSSRNSRCYQDGRHILSRS